MLRCTQSEHRDVLSCPRAGTLSTANASALSMQDSPSPPCLPLRARSLPQKDLWPAWSDVGIGNTPGRYEVGVQYGSIWHNSLAHVCLFGKATFPAPQIWSIANYPCLLFSGHIMGVTPSVVIPSQCRKTMKKVCHLRKEVGKSIRCFFIRSCLQDVQQRFPAICLRIECWKTPIACFETSCSQFFGDHVRYLGDIPLDKPM